MSRPRPRGKSAGKAKASSKARRAPVIDFSSPAAALSSAPPGYDWLEEGIRQEGQGERYQFGAKAQRHFTNALVSYQCASTRDPTSFDALYNAGRINLHLATDHLPAPQCCQAATDAIAAFRRSLEVERAREEPAPSTSNLIDATFNLAQALVALQELVEEGAADDVANEETNGRLEAKVHFLACEEMQMSEMEKAGLGGTGADFEIGETDEMELQDESDFAVDVDTRAAVETHLVTPSMVVDTILEGVTNGIALFSTVRGDPPSAVSHHQEITSALARATTLVHLVPLSQASTLELDLALATLSFRATWADSLPSTSARVSATAAIAADHKELLSRAPRNAEQLSAYADFLLDSLTSRTDILLLETLREALGAYELVHSILSDRLSPPRSVPAHVTPSLLSANLLSRSYVYLIIHHHHRWSSARDAEAAIQTAYRLAQEAADVNGVGITVSIDHATGNPTATRSTQEGRKDWRATHAFGRAPLMLLRIGMRMGWDEDPGLGRVLGGAMSRSAIRAGLDDIRDDVAWEAAGEGVEEAWWTRVMNDLST